MVSRLRWLRAHPHPVIDTGNSRNREVCVCGFSEEPYQRPEVSSGIARGVTDIVAVPLFISSWSSIVTSTECLLGLPADAPAALAVYAKMNHDAAGAHDAASHAGDATTDGTSPVRSRVPIRMTPRSTTIQSWPTSSRAARVPSAARRRAKRSSSSRTVRTRKKNSRRWLADMAALAGRIRRAEPFASIDYLTLRDDAPKPVRDQATAALRNLVQRHSKEGRRALIVPLLISFGGIDRGLRECLEGLPYAMADAGLMPEDRLATWVLAMADEK
jgi:sirohydrochlorin cobaltochelatase